MIDYSSELRREKRLAYELCIAIIVGEQNQLKSWDSPEYKVLQRVLQRVNEEIKDLDEDRMESVPVVKDEKDEKEEDPKNNIVPTTLNDFRVGDTVLADSNPYNLRAFKLPGYLSGNSLKVIGFTKNKVICDWDGGKPFYIYPELLRKVEGDFEKR